MKPGTPRASRLKRIAQIRKRKGLREAKYYHAGSDQGGSSINTEKGNHTPIWLGHRKDTVKQYFQFNQHDKGAHIGRYYVKGKVAHHKDPEVKALFGKVKGGEYHGHQRKYHTHLSNDPSAKDVHDHPMTKKLKDHGYVGYSHPDMRAQASHRNNTVVFHRGNVEKTKDIHKRSAEISYDLPTSKFKADQKRESRSKKKHERKMLHRNEINQRKWANRKHTPDVTPSPRLERIAQIRKKKGLDEARYYHSGNDEGGFIRGDKKSGKSPIWLGHRKHTVKKYYRGGAEGSHISRYHVKGKIAHHADPKVRYGYFGHPDEQDEYHHHLSANPNAKDVHSHPVTKALKKDGYVGYTHQDHRSEDNDTNTVVFHRKHVERGQTFHKGKTKLSWDLKPSVQKADEKRKERAATKAKKRLERFKRNVTIDEKRFYHAGSDQGGVHDNDEKSNHAPIWFGHRKETAKAYYRGDRKGAHVSRYNVKGKIAHHADPKVKKLVKNAASEAKANNARSGATIIRLPSYKSPQDRYHDDLSDNPSAKQVHDHPITKALKKHGYVGYSHPDTLEGSTKDRNTVVFHRKHVEKVKQLHGSGVKLKRHREEDLRRRDRQRTSKTHRRQDAKKEVEYQKKWKKVRDRYDDNKEEPKNPKRLERIASIRKRKGLREAKYYHAGSDQGGTVRAGKDVKSDHSPIWFGHRKETAKFYYFPKAKGAHVSRYRIKGKVLHHRDPEAKKHFKSGMDKVEYERMLSGDHPAKDVHDHPATRSIKKAGYVGYSHQDDNMEGNAAHRNTVVFHRKHAEKTKQVYGPGSNLDPEGPTWNKMRKERERDTRNRPKLRKAYLKHTAKMKGDDSPAPKPESPRLERIAQIRKRKGLQEKRFYHAGSDEGGIVTRDERSDHAPIWLGHRKETAKGYYVGRKMGAHLSRYDVKGKIAHHKDPKVKGLFRDHGHSQHDYHYQLSENPRVKTVHDHPATKTLKKHGYVGYSHPDTMEGAARNHNTVVFHRKHVEKVKQLHGADQRLKKRDDFSLSLRDARRKHKTLRRREAKKEVEYKKRWQRVYDDADGKKEDKPKNPKRLERIASIRKRKGLDEKYFYHAGTHQEKRSDKTPIWMGHRKWTAKYYSHGNTDGHVSRYKVKGKVAHHADPEVKKVFADHGHNQYNYHRTLSTEPTAKAVHGHPITKALKKHGYVGYSHPDLAFNANDDDGHPMSHNTVVFHRKHVEHDKTLHKAAFVKHKVKPSILRADDRRIGRKQRKRARKDPELSALMRKHFGHSGYH